MRENESGNILFYILIAVTLLAALSFAIAQSTRGNISQITEEKARIYSTEIIEYANAMANAVAQLRLRSVGADELCFDHANWGANDYDHGGCADDRNRIFHPDGGGVNWANAPDLIMNSNATPDYLWHIYGDNEIDEIGTTCATSACSDLVLYLDELQEMVCIQLNKLLGVGIPGDPPPTDTDMGETRFVGTYDYSNTIGDEVAGSDLVGKRAGCFQKTNAPAEYVFYRVLLAR